MLEVREVSHTYPSRRRQGPSLHRVSFSAGAGESVFVLGPNGSGKSTLFKLLLKLLPLRSGSITIDGRDAGLMRHRDLARIISYIPQDQDVTFNFTVLDTVLMGRTAHMGAIANRVSNEDLTLAHDSLDALGIAHLAGRGLRELSGGERQLVFTARALCQGGKVLVLDEPTSNLDFANQELVLAQVRGLAELGYLVLISTHNPMHALHYADSLLLLREGQLLGHHRPSEVSEALLSDLYGSPIRLVTSPEAPGLNICLPAGPHTGPSHTSTPNTPKGPHGLATL